MPESCVFYRGKGALIARTAENCKMAQCRKKNARVQSHRQGWDEDEMILEPTMKG